MRRKHNPLIALLSLLLLALILTWVCGGCAVQTEAAETEPAPRFTTEYGGNRCTIITDNQTGVQYLFYYFPDMTGRAGGGLTRLEAE